MFDLALFLFAVFFAVIAFLTHVMFDMFGAPHRRKKHWFEFWREK